MSKHTTPASPPPLKIPTIRAETPQFKEARSNLLESIRTTGGFANAGLKPVQDRILKEEFNEATEKPVAKVAKGRGDLMKDLARNLASRGRGALTMPFGRGKKK